MIDLSYKEAAAFLKEHDGFVVFSHASPDGDTVGSAVALVRILRSMGKDAVAVCADKLPDKLKFLVADEFTDSVPENIKTAISVDVASAAMLGALSQFADGRELDLVFDHHTVSTLPCKHRLVREHYIANGEIIFELARELGVTPDLQTATALYAAICSDSGGLRYENTRPETYEYAAELIRLGVDFPAVCRRLFEQKTHEQTALEKAAYNALRFYHGGRLAIVAIDAETVAECKAADDAFDSVYSIPRQIAGVELSAVLRPKNGIIKGSLRSNEYFDVAALAEKYGGGGHKRAAGFRMACSLEEAVTRLVADTKELL